MAAEKDSYELFEDVPAENPAGESDGAAPVPAAAAAGTEDRPRRAPLFPPRRTPGVEKIVPEDIDVRDVGGGRSFGQYLRELRERNHLSVDEIAETTRISRNYVEALEAEDFDRLPPLAYVLAYVKTLCALYQVPAERIAEVTAELREHLSPELPEDISKSVIDREESEEDIRRIRQLTVILAAAAVLLVVVLAVGGVLIWAGIRRASAPPAVEPVDQVRLVEIQGMPQLEPTRLRAEEARR